jgi:hypothetical protein
VVKVGDLKWISFLARFFNLEVAHKSFPSIAFKEKSSTTFFAKITKRLREMFLVPVW